MTWHWPVFWQCGQRKYWNGIIKKKFIDIIVITSSKWHWVRWVTKANLLIALLKIKGNNALTSCGFCVVRVFVLLPPNCMQSRRRYWKCCFNERFCLKHDVRWHKSYRCCFSMFNVLWFSSSVRCIDNCWLKILVKFGFISEIDLMQTCRWIIDFKSNAQSPIYDVKNIVGWNQNVCFKASCCKCSHLCKKGIKLARIEKSSIEFSRCRWV